MKYRLFALSALVALCPSGVLAAEGMTPQAIVFVAVPPHIFGDVFPVHPMTNAAGLVPTLTVVSGPATVSGEIVTTTGAGTVTLRATQPGNAVYAAATPVTQVFTVATAPATVTLSALAQPFDEAPRIVIATTVPVLLPVRLTYNGSDTAPTSPGSYFVIATIDDANYRGFATGTLVVGAGRQAIEFGAVPIPTHLFGDVPFTVTPTASSGLPVALRVLSGPATVNGTTVTLIGAGTVVLQATQAGNGNYAFVTLTQSFDVLKRLAPVLLGQLAQVANGSARQALAATMPVGLVMKITYNESPTAPTAAGSYTVVATIDDDNYQGLATGTLTVAAGTPTSLAAQAVSFGPTPIPNHIFGDGGFDLNPTSSSGLPVTLSVASGPATVSGRTVKLTGAGLVTLLASQPGDSVFAPTSVTQVFDVAKALAKVSVSGVVEMPDGSYRLATATVPSGLPVIITYNGSIVPPSAQGTYVVLVAINALNFRGTAGGTLVIGPNAQTIAFPFIEDRTVDDLPFDVGPTASSGLPVVVTVVSGPALVTGRKVTLTGAGIVILQASQAGNANFGPASITQSFVVGVGNNQAPEIAVAPFGQTIARGGRVAFTVVGTGTPEPTYQWFFDLLPIAGATGATLTLENLQPGQAGAYTVTLTNVAGLVTTRAAMLAVDAGGSRSPSRIMNFSARGWSAQGSQSLIVGFVATGDRKSVLVRGIGPALANFGVANALADPLLTLQGSLGLEAANDNWQTGGDSSSMAAVASRVAAFPLPNGSKDSALLAVLEGGAYTMSLARTGGSAGIALVEVYDTDSNLASRLINLSARMQVTAGEGALIAGFVISGELPKTVLIRGIGPTLAAFGVEGTLPDPRITLFGAGGIIASNDDWEIGVPAAQTTEVFARVGAFPLPAGSKDAALIATLEPGAYTVQVTGGGDASGVALVEIYDLP